VTLCERDGGKPKQEVVMRSPFLSYRRPKRECETCTPTKPLSKKDTLFEEKKRQRRQRESEPKRLGMQGREEGFLSQKRKNRESIWVEGNRRAGKPVASSTTHKEASSKSMLRLGKGQKVAGNQAVKSPDFRALRYRLKGDQREGVSEGVRKQEKKETSINRMAAGLGSLGLYEPGNTSSWGGELRRSSRVLQRRAK